MPKTMEDLLSYNRNWSKRKRDEDPAFFENMQYDQHPKYLWIGCADSRLPPNRLLGVDLGELFVHRNVANLAHADDDNVQSVLHYGIKVLKIEHVLLCGHYGCGGITAALNDQAFGPLVKWLADVRQLALDNKAELDAIPSETDRINRLSELNVLAQVKALEVNPAVVESRANGHQVRIHGLMYDLKTGKLQELI